MNETCRVVVCVRELFPDENGAKLTSVVVVVGGAGQQHFGRGCLSWLYLLHYYTDKNQGQSYAHSAKTYYYLHQEDSSSPSKIANKFIIFSATLFISLLCIFVLKGFFCIFQHKGKIAVIVYWLVPCVVAAVTQVRILVTAIPIFFYFVLKLKKK